MIEPRNPNPLTYGQTGRALVDPAPLISTEQAEADRQAFLESAKEWRREQNRKRDVKVKEKKLPKQTPPTSIAEARSQILKAKIDKGAELRSEGYSDAEIYRRIHVAPKTLVKHLGPPPRKPTQKLPEDERRKKQAEAEQLLERGFNYSQIAERVGVSKQSVSNWFQPSEKKAA